MKKILIAISFVLLSFNAYGAGSSSSDSSNTVKKTNSSKNTSNLKLKIGKYLYKISGDLELLEVR